MSFSVLRTYEEELQVLSGVQGELESVSSEKMTLQKELSNLEGMYKVMETLRDSQETELQTLKVLRLLCFCGGVVVVHTCLNRPKWKYDNQLTITLL